MLVNSRLIILNERTDKMKRDVPIWEILKMVRSIFGANRKALKKEKIFSRLNRFPRVAWVACAQGCAYCWRGGRKEDEERGGNLGHQ